MTIKFQIDFTCMAKLAYAIIPLLCISSFHACDVIDFVRNFQHECFIASRQINTPVIEMEME